MNTMSIREKAVVATLGMLALYALAAVLWFVSQESAWKKARRDYEKKREQYVKEEKLIGEKKRWADDYELEKSRMPMFEADASNTDTKWMRKMDEYAAKYHLVFAQTQIGKEVEAGEVLERTIDVRNFEGSLEALVKFLYELNSTGEGMFDMKSLTLKPSNKRGYLKGSFTITCAYMKGN